MKDIIKLLAEIVNNIHDVINYIVLDVLNLNMTDKDLHFWVMGILGFVIFIVVLLISRYIASLPYGITILSFLYTFTFMVAIVFAIEIQQAITNRGHMEFEDAVIGLWGFIVFFIIFAAISLIGIYINRFIQNYRKKQRVDNQRRTS